MQNNISALLEFFNPEIIKTKFTYKDNEKIEIDEDKIVIDELEFNNNKINLFSTEFLIMNGLKSKINESDFKIYNSDKYSVDIFSKFLEEIFLDINNFINNNNSENDFIKNHFIKLHKKIYSHFISAKLDYNDKKQLNEMKEEYNVKNSFIKININQVENKEKDIKSNKNPKELIDNKSLFSGTTISDLIKKNHIILRI